MNQDQFNHQQPQQSNQGQYQVPSQEQIPTQGQYQAGSYHPGQPQQSQYQSAPGQYPPGYPQNPYGAPQSQGNGLAIAGLVMGIVSCIFVFLLYWLGLIAGIVGIIISALAVKKAKNGMAIAGLVLSIIGTAIGVIILILAIICVASIGNIIRSYPH